MPSPRIWFGAFRKLQELINYPCLSLILVVVKAHIPWCNKVSHPCCLSWPYQHGQKCPEVPRSAQKCPEVLRFCGLIIIVPGSPIALGFATTGALQLCIRCSRMKSWAAQCWIPWTPLVYDALCIYPIEYVCTLSRYIVNICKYKHTHTLYIYIINIPFKYTL